MDAEKKSVYFLGGIAGLFAGYWLYLYLQDTSNPPGIGEVFDNIKSYITRAQVVVTGAIGDVTGTSSYMEKAAAFIMKQESFSARVYNDQGHPAIGYGHDILAGEPYDQNYVMTESEGYDLLLNDMTSRDDCIAQSVQVALSDNQRAALLSFVYNEGCHAFQTSTMIRKINSGDFQGAAAEFDRWIYATDPQSGAKLVLAALQTRRSDEQALFLS